MDEPTPPALPPILADRLRYLGVKPECAHCQRAVLEGQQYFVVSSGTAAAHAIHERCPRDWRRIIGLAALAAGGLLLGYLLVRIVGG